MGPDRMPPEDAVGRSILIVEDEKEIRDLLVHYLPREGFSPTTDPRGETGGGHLGAGDVHPQIAVNEHVLPRLPGFGGAAPDDGLDPGDDLPGAERLRDVIVGAQFQPDDPVRLVPLGRQHHHGGPGGRGVGPDLPEQVQPVHPREQDVEKDQFRLLRSRLLPPGLSVGSHRRRKPFPAEGVDEQVPDLLLVLHDEDGSSHCVLRRNPVGTHYIWSGKGRGNRDVLMVSKRRTTGFSRRGKKSRSPLIPGGAPPVSSAASRK